MVRRKTEQEENPMFSTIGIKGKNSSNTRKLHYLQKNVEEINAEGENWSPNPEQP